MVSTSVLNSECENLQSRYKNPTFFFCTSSGNGNGSEPETEWERLLKPFDIKQLRKSLNKITPYQLKKLLELPLDVSTSMEIFQWAGHQKGYCHSFDVYYALIDKVGAAQEFKVIDRLLLQMKEEGVVFKESLFILVMKYYEKAGLPGQATRLLLDMRTLFSCEPTFRSYNVVLEILVAGDCPEVAPNVFYEMLNRGISPTVYTFGVVMKALCKVNEVDAACSLLRDMTKHGCVPNAIIYQTLIHSLSKVNRVNEALKLLEEMFLMGCTPDVDTFNDVIHGLCRTKRIHEAAKLVDRMLLRGFTPNAFTYGVLIHGLCRAGQVNEARALLDKVPEPNTVLVNTLINGYVTNGGFDEAKAVLNEIISRTGFDPDVYTYTILIRGLCKNRSFSLARDLMDEMAVKSCKPNVITYTILIDGFCKVGRLNEASDVVHEMSAKGLSLNTVGYNCLINALCKDGNVHKALEMFGELLSKGCKPDVFTFSSLIYGLCKVDKMEEALRMYHDMLLEGVIANNVTYNTLIHAFLRKGATQEALKLVNDMLFRGCALDDITYSGLIKALCKDGAIEKALGLFEDMTRKGLTYLSWIVSVLRDPESALPSSSSSYYASLSWGQQDIVPHVLMPLKPKDGEDSSCSNPLDTLLPFEHILFVACSRTPVDLGVPCILASSTCPDGDKEFVLSFGALGLGTNQERREEIAEYLGQFRRKVDIRRVVAPFFAGYTSEYQDYVVPSHNRASVKIRIKRRLAPMAEAVTTDREGVSTAEV
ncbi:hypothetical protein RJ639_022634 [Escallonia herrerae]|uniref:Pentatricopeptide repeat-containing protein n=1 Tax=Escallonia herrerae TaxID=1293975 RepID=A0AA88V1R7_9ASTE|nr:hypothetical protein RJ639_022634 [Escallonia herrerae]